MIFFTGNDWEELLKEEIEKNYFKSLSGIIGNEYESNEVYPDETEIFNALKYTSYQDIKVVIIGQDPYIGPNQAHGLSFSVRPEVTIPPSLMNIFIELSNDIGCKVPDNGCLIPWAQQGVLLLNTVLTVRRGMSNFHKGIGWEIFTDRIIEEINKKDSPVVFMLWGKYAQLKADFLNNSKHLVLLAPHPSPMNRGAFFGCKHFSKANKFLRENKAGEINWQIPNLYEE